MILILFFGLLAITLVIVFRNKLFGNYDNQLIQILSKQQWFQNPWLSGLLLLSINMLLIAVPWLLLGLLLLLPEIPYIHLLIPVLPVICSTLVWATFGLAWQGSKADRIKMSLLGNSLYLLIIGFFIYLYISYQPSSPDEDTFMVTLGWDIGILVSFTAFITSFCLTNINKNINT